MFRKPGFLLIVILIFSIFSCNDTSIFMPLGEEAEFVQVNTIEKGTLVFPDNELPVSIDYDVENVSPDKIEIQLLSADGEILGTENLENEAIEEPLPPVTLPDLSPGMYKLKIIVFDKDEVLTEKEVEFFYVKGNYSIRGITTYPPVLYPGSGGLLFTDITFPEGASPYLRWSMEDVLISEGYKADGTIKLQWTAPEAEGVYSIKLELFPTGPSPGTQSYPFTSPVVMDVQIYVSEKQGAGKTELKMEDQYYSLFHFRGNINDSGVRDGKKELIFIGNPELDVKSDYFGYYLDGSSGFQENSLLLPVYNGMLNPFSISFRLYPDGDQADKNLFTCKSEDENLFFNLCTDSQGLLNVQLNINGTQILSSPGIPELLLKEINTLTLSVIPQDKNILFLWFNNGEMVFIDEHPFSNRIETPAGISVIGGENGFTGIIDELGILYLDKTGRFAADPDVYKRAMETIYGNTLVYAEGFDGIYTPDKLIIKNDVLTNRGSLILQPGAEVSLPAFHLGYEELSFEVKLSESESIPKGTVIVKYEDSHESLFEISLDGKVTISDNGNIMFNRTDNLLKFNLINSENEFTLFNDSDKVELENYSEYSGSIIIRIENTDEQNPLEIDSILIKKKSISLVKKNNILLDARGNSL